MNRPSYFAGLVGKMTRQSQGIPRPRLGPSEKVALLGLATAVVTLSFTVVLQLSMRQARDVRIPLSVNTSRLQVGIVQSSGETARWVAFGESGAKKRRQGAFSELIEPSTQLNATLEQLAKDPEIGAQFEAYTASLRRLERVQLLIEDVASEPGDLPARGLYQARVEPKLVVLERGFFLIQKRGGPAMAKDAGSVAELRNQIVSLDRTVLRLLERRDRSARFDVERQVALVRAQVRPVQAAHRRLPESELKESLGYLLDETRFLLRLVEPLTTEGDGMLVRRSTQLARTELQPLANELQRLAAEETQHQTQASLQSIGHLRRFGAGVVVLALLMGLTSAASLYTSMRMSHRMSEVLHKAQKLGQYRIQERLGGGAMGDVYRAQHALLRRPTAIKVLKPSNSGDVDAQARFQDEVQLTSLLTHPNTVQVFDYGRTPEGLFYFAMELLDGVDIQRLVDRTGPLAPGRVVFLLKQACGSLAEAHRQGLLHRDIKLSNLMLTKRGLQYDVLKVLDFGLARIHSREGQGELVGTPGYMAPEVIERRHFDLRTEIYALGCVAYEMVTGVPPFDSSDVPELLRAHREDSLRRPSVALGRSIPQDLEAIIVACLEKDSALRPPDVDSLWELLDATEISVWTQLEARAWWMDHGELLESHPESTDATKISFALERRTFS